MSKNWVEFSLDLNNVLPRIRHFRLCSRARNSGIRRFPLRAALGSDSARGSHFVAGYLFRRSLCLGRTSRAAFPVSRRGLAQDRLDRRRGVRITSRWVPVPLSLPAKTRCQGLTKRCSERLAGSV